ncbi:conserved hypothetical protein-putative permease of ABC transporter [Mucinivorans hirudinis]|uniref:ABC3 transporter permease C-terminal domain-containing protein n=1 Tax=Mucinivorans hirudinis TaxID=1433126 RepID=A0A060RB83_9BACT|nr:conserved hypothetical protein-putative permease of ABC transporter [Mucinivorans hirudinis]
MKSLINNNIRYYKNSYRLVALAATIAVAVILGSLIIGDSVRATLLKRAEARLGDIESVIVANSSFLDAAAYPNGKLFTNGFISVAGRFTPVNVWGEDGIEAGYCLVNGKLSSQIESEVVLRLPSGGLIPSGSLFVTDNYTASLRLTNAGIKDNQADINLRNEQIVPLNIFVNGEELANAMGLQGKVNVIFHESIIDLKDWLPEHSGLHLVDGELRSDRIFLQREAVDKLLETNPKANRLFSYLANSIDDIPYSFITAADRYNNLNLNKEDAIISDYTATRLGKRIGDKITITYFVSPELKLLQTDSSQFIIRAIVPQSTFAADSTLSADFPGLTNVESCTDWDSDLPIDFSKITDQDKAYWAQYRATPKVIISYESIKERWSNGYGVATALRGIDNTGGLTPAMLGVTVIYPRKSALAAASSAVDFASLFLSLGFFIIVAAIMLILLPINEMIAKRREEISLLVALGFSAKRVKMVILQEALPVILFSLLAGAVLGLIYSFTVLWLLETVWQGATYTDGFIISINIPTLAIGLISSLLILLGAILSLNPSKTSKTITPRKPHLKLKIATIFICWLAIQISLISSNIAITGLCFIIGTFAVFDYELARIRNSNSLSTKLLPWLRMGYNRRSTLTALLTLEIGIFVLTTIGINRPTFDKDTIGSGGYSHWAESSVPIYYDLNSEQGREKFSLQELSSTVSFLPMARQEGDDASCLNLNKPQQVTLLGVAADSLIDSKFEFAQTLDNLEGEEVFKKLASTTNTAIVDATVLEWSLAKAVGDTIRYADGRYFIIIGTLKNSLFQGNIITDIKNLPQTNGTEVMLVKNANNEDKALIERALSNYGMVLSPSSERLKEFNSVTDTYLTIFMSLGWIALLLGAAAFVVSVRKNLILRNEELELYRALGFSQKKRALLLYRENIIIPLYSLLFGITISLCTSMKVLGNVSPEMWVALVVFVALYVAITTLLLRSAIFVRDTKCERDKSY